MNEDAAHALGAVVDGKKVGDSKNFVCFSFYANKNMTMVDGGFLASPNKKMAEHARSLRLHGLSSDAWNRFHNKSKLIFEVTELGYKYNTNDVHAAIGRVQLKKFSTNQKKRTQFASIYDSVFSDVPGVTLQQKKFSDEKTKHALHLYTVVLDSVLYRGGRDKVIELLRKEGVFAVVHYLPLHQHLLYQDKFRLSSNDFPVARYVGENIISLPLLPQLKEVDARIIAETTKKVLLNFLKRNH
ncbi:MAG: hypothetical protein UY04_C0020G0013 [Parcubacteria group bacterium GW2011_GWA2_47_7]|nr:MAG: hypothetical protein UY04_C0020G0013 [Parcubacteria group bacterium GW2011_GWA2_47_7]